MIRFGATLTGPMATYVDDKIKKGLYKSPSEYINDLVRQKMAEEEKNSRV